MIDDEWTVGLYGKLPSHGDFLRRRLSDDFVRTWDEWLQRGMDASRSAFGDQWLDIYLTSPVWRFACAAGACGAMPAIGVMAPSVDRAGRSFPMTIAACLPSWVDPIAAMTHGEAFFQRAEQVAIDTLTAECVDFAEFDDQVMALTTLLTDVCDLALHVEPSALAIVNADSSIAWQIALPSLSHMSTTFERLLAMQIGSRYQPAVIWSTEGSARIVPTCLVRRGLPDAASFVALFDGAWTERDWKSVVAQVSAPSFVPS